MLSISIAVVILVGTLESFSEPFTAEGTLTIEEFSNDVALPDRLQRNFTAQVNNDKWLIRISSTEALDRAGVGVVEQSFDGETLFQQFEYKLPSAPQPNTRKNDKGFVPVNAHATVRKQRLPVITSGVGESAVWLAYAARNNLNTNAQGQLAVLWDDSLLVKNRVQLPATISLWENGFFERVEWRNDGLIRFEEENVGMKTTPHEPPYDKGFLNSTFSTVLTNYAGFRVPAEFDLTSYVIWYPYRTTNEVARRKRVHGRLSSLRRGAEEAGLALTTRQPTAVTDYRLAESDATYELNYVVTNTGSLITPLTNQAQLTAALGRMNQYAREHNIHVVRTDKVLQKRRWSLMVLLLVLGAGIAFLLIRGSIKRSVPDNITTK